MERDAPRRAAEGDGRTRSDGGGEAELEFLVLGPLEVRARGDPIDVGGAKQRAVLAMLLLRAGDVVSRDELIREMWDTEPPDNAAQALNVRISRLRKSLAGQGRRDIIVTTARGYALRVGDSQLDLRRFERLVDEARAALESDPARARELFVEALGLWRGQALSDLALEPFARIEIDRLEELRLTALDGRIEADLALGRHAEVIGELEALVARYPLRERFGAQLMLAHYRSGRQADALAVYGETRRHLVDELGLEPGRALHDLEAAILRHDPGLDLPAVRVPEDVPPDRPSGTARSRRRFQAVLAVASVAVLGLVALAAAAWPGEQHAPTPPNSVAVLHAGSTAAFADIPVGTRPGPVVTSPGAVWVANLDDSTVSRIDPVTRHVLRTISVGFEPGGLAWGDGALWVTGPRGIVSRINPAYDTIRRFKKLPTAIIRFPLPERPFVIVGHSAWMVIPTGQLVRLDLRSGRAAPPIDIGANASAVAAGFGGAVWVADTFDNTVSRVDPTGAVTTVPVGHGPSGIAVGAGAVWVTDRYDDAVVRIDPATRSVTNTISVGVSPKGIAFAGGEIWVADTHSHQLSRIDPTRLTVQAVDTTGSPVALAASGSDVYASLEGDVSVAGHGVAHLAVQTDAGSIDPAIAFFGPAWPIGHAMCGLLAGYGDGTSLMARPELASSVTHSPDGRRWTFHIRRGVRFSPPSGAPVTAASMKATIERAVSPRMTGPGSVSLTDLVGETAFVKGKTAHISGITTRGSELTLRMTRPAPELLQVLAMPAFCAVPADAPLVPRATTLLPSAGPYYAAAYIPGQELVLRRNPYYRGPRPARIAAFDIQIGLGTQRMIREIEGGTLDYSLEPLPSSQLQAAYGTPRVGQPRYLLSPVPDARFLILNTSRPLFAHTRLRRAVALALDRRALVDAWNASANTGAGGLPALATDSYLPPGIPGAPAMTPAARADIRRARVIVGPIHRRAVMFTSAAAPYPEMAHVVKTDLGRIGIGVTIKSFPDAPAMYHRIAMPGAPYDITTLGWLPNYLDPEFMLDPLLNGTSVNNWAHYDDPRTDARLRAAVRLFGRSRSIAYARLARDVADTAAPMVAFSNEELPSFFSARVGCIVYQPEYGIDLAHLCLH